MFSSSSSCITAFAVVLMALIHMVYAYPERTPLGKIKYYEPLQFSQMHFQNYATSTNGQLTFSAFNINFFLYLKPSHDTLHPKLTATRVDISGVHRNIDDILPLMSNHYVGTLRGDPDGKACLHVDTDAGIVRGSIITSTDTFIIEPSARHSEHIVEPMIIYRKQDIEPYVHRDPLQHVYEEYDVPVEDGIDTSTRSRRSSSFATTCLVHVVADQHFLSSHENEHNAIDEIIHMFNSVNEIFKQIPLIRFSISNLTLYTNKESDPYWFKSAPTVEGLLDTFSDRNWDHVCLAHLFTRYTFGGGTIGFANLASEQSGTSGGICAKNAFFQSKNKKSSTNTGLTTTLAYDSPLPLDSIIEVMAHELGHNCGSPHDSMEDMKETWVESECGDPKRFIMYFSTSKNDNLFSSCSKTKFEQVIKAKGNCLVEKPEGLCGNFIFEPENDEECDGGFDGNNCCAKDCKLKPGATCNDDNHGCCKNCLAIDDSNFVCKRFSASSCFEDLKCNGINTTCLDDLRIPKANGTTCIQDDIYPESSCSGGTCVNICSKYKAEVCSCEEDDLECVICCKGTDPSSKFLQNECKPFAFVYPDLSVSKNCKKVPDSTSSYSDCALNLTPAQPCRIGICFQGQCAVQLGDYVDLINNILEQISKILRWIKANPGSFAACIIGAILIISSFIGACGPTKQGRKMRRRMSFHRGNPSIALRDMSDKPMVRESAASPRPASMAAPGPSKGRPKSMAAPGPSKGRPKSMAEPSPSRPRSMAPPSSSQNRPQSMAPSSPSPARPQNLAPPPSSQKRPQSMAPSSPSRGRPKSMASPSSSNNSKSPSSSKRISTGSSQPLMNNSRDKSPRRNKK